MLEFNCLGVRDLDRYEASHSRLSRWRIRTASEDFDLAAATRCDVFIASAQSPQCWSALEQVRTRLPDVIRVVETKHPTAATYQNWTSYHRLIDSNRDDCLQRLSESVLLARSLVNDRNLRQRLLAEQVLPRGPSGRESHKGDPQPIGAPVAALNDPAIAAALLKSCLVGDDWLRDLESEMNGPNADNLAAMLLTIPTKAALSGFSVEQFSRQAARVAGFAEALGKQCHLTDRSCAELRMAGLLHDIGRLALAQAASWEYCEIDQLAELTERPAWELERRVLGADHMQAGAFLAAIWGFPEPLREAIELHHEPRRGRSKDGHAPLSAVYAASTMTADSAERPDRDFLQDVGLDRALDEISAPQSLAFEPS